jgi:hypothetical protein
MHADGVPILQIRDFPDSLYGKLAQSARIGRRSLARQATVLLERALNAPTEPRTPPRTAYPVLRASYPAPIARAPVSGTIDPQGP